MGTGEHYITVLPADWSLSISPDLFAVSFYGEEMAWNPYLYVHKYRCLPSRNGILLSLSVVL